MNIAARVIELIRNGETICLATVVSSENAEIAAGRKAIVFKNGSLEGDLADGKMGSGIRDSGLEAIKEEKRGLVEVLPGIHVFF